MYHVVNCLSHCRTAVQAPVCPVGGEFCLASVLVTRFADHSRVDGTCSLPVTDVLQSCRGLRCSRVCSRQDSLQQHNMRCWAPQQDSYCISVSDCPTTCSTKLTHSHQRCQPTQQQQPQDQQQQHLSISVRKPCISYLSQPPTAAAHSLKPRCSTYSGWPAQRI